MTRPSWLRFVTDDRGRDVPMAAVALATPTGEHVGVVFRDEDNEPRFSCRGFWTARKMQTSPSQRSSWRQRKPSTTSAMDAAADPKDLSHEPTRPHRQ